MNRCPITYEYCGVEKYSKKGLKLLSRNLQKLHDFPLTSKEQIQRATELAAKLSIQGVQPKLSIKLNLKKELFEIVETGGRYIMKPPHHLYEELPQNEDLTMKLAKIVGIEVPFHGMIFNMDRSLSYVVKRFDRLGRNQKVAVEDFSQLLGYSRDTKYDSSMEKVVSVLEKHCTFPFIEKKKLFRLVLFNFLVGNEDMHLKNFTLISRDNKVEFSPVYDLINTTIVLKSKEEIALPIRGKKSNLNCFDLIEYFAIHRLGLGEIIIKDELMQFERSFEAWNLLISNSFLSKPYQDQYKNLIMERWRRLQH
ncbi:MAG: HipA domain-containing protein [Chlamydiota bacterium]